MQAEEPTEALQLTQTLAGLDVPPQRYGRLV